MSDDLTRPVTVVIVHWNQPYRCINTVEAFRRQGVPVRLLIVDNGSDPKAVDILTRLEADSPDVELVRLGVNAGFGPGANAGLRAWLESPTHEADDWVALAPHDALPAEDCLETMLAAARDEPRAGLMCADVGDGHIPVVDPYFGGMTVPAPDATHVGWEDVDYPHGTLMMAKRACLAQIGLFDERYFAYCEEADLGLRAHRAGWRVGLVRGSRVTNPTMRSGSPAVDYLMQRNTLLLVRENSGAYHASIRLMIAAWHLTRGLISPAPGTFVFSAKGRGRGMLDFVRGRYGPPPQDLMGEAQPSERV